MDNNDLVDDVKNESIKHLFPATPSSEKHDEFRLTFTRSEFYGYFNHAWNDVYWLAHAIIRMGFIGVLAQHHTQIHMETIGARMRIASCSLIYRKSLRLSALSASTTGSGYLVNLMSNDVGRSDKGFLFCHCIWILPFQSIVTCYLIWLRVRWAAVIGVIGLLLKTVPVQTRLSHYIAALRMKVAQRTDNRVGIMIEIINGIQVIKMYAWEIPFRKVVAEAHHFGIKQIRCSAYIFGINLSSFVFIERSTLFIAIATCILTGQNIMADIVFSVAQYFNILQLNADIFYPLSLALGAEALVSIRRIEEFLLKDEENEAELGLERRSSVIVAENIVEMNDVSASWDEDSGEMNQRHGSNSNANTSEISNTDGSHEEACMDEVKKILIVDARSYASAVTNRASGGVCECAEYYPCAAIEFMNLGNIHVIRKSFHALRALAASPTDSQSWFTALDRTMWLSHLAVIVQCSDGWDRTPQLVSTALLYLDPYYRTVDGFRILVEREWLSFDYKFADRIGHGPGSDETNERFPVFLQWLDCVYQIQKQFPCSFEFSMTYLIKLAQHVFSCMFGMFLCNTYEERTENSLFDRTYSVWPFLSGSMYKNSLYIPNREKDLWPAYHPSDLSYWAEVCSSSFGNQDQSDSSMTTSIPPAVPVGTAIVTSSTNDISNSEPLSPMIETRSYRDLQTAGGYNGMIRRSSDPNMTADMYFSINLSMEPSIETLPEYANETNLVDMKVIDDQTIANFCSDTIRELNTLTEELQHSNSDEIGVPLRSHHENQNSFNMSNKLNGSIQSDAIRSSIHDATPKTSVHSLPDDQHFQLTPPITTNARNNFIMDHNLMVSYYNSTMYNGNSNVQTERSCDDVLI